MGDYNINTLSEINRNSNQTQEFINIFSTYYYHKLISLPSRERSQSCSLIDNVYTDIPDCYNTCTSGVLKFLTQSDHYPIFTIRHATETPKPKTHITKRNHSEKNVALFKKCIKQHNWNSLLYVNDIKQTFSQFINTIISYHNRCFPFENKKINYKNRNPWINHTLKKEIEIRDRLFQISKKNPTTENIKAYKTYKNKNLSNQRQAEKIYYREQFELNVNDLKKSWQVIKTIIGKEDKCTIKNKEFLINNMYLSDNKVIANSFNNYFINVGRSLAKNIHSNIDPLLYIESNIHTIHVPEISEHEIMSVITMLNNAAAGHDELPASIMKQCAEFYIQPLTRLINMSIIQGIFPDELKLARVIPIYKGEDDQLISNYRPISVLPYFSKIFEKIISLHVIDFLEENHIFYDYQFGFRKNHSTSHAIIALVEKVSKALDTGKCVVGVFLDLKKAFDTVDHDILLHKLEKYGIKDNLLQWFRSYLKDRSQYVEYNNHKSERKTITHGVPQGSILGPLLFILYMNDFSRSSDLLFSIIFADDTSVFIEGTQFDEIIKVLNNELEKVNVWLKANKLTINIQKTHYMMFHRTKIKKKNRKQIIICGNDINYASSTKFLGVIIDNKMSWAEHILYIKNKISKSVGIINKVRNFVDKQTLRNLYFTFVYPYLIYCIEIWGNTNDTHLNPIILVQKKCIRAITFSHYLESTAPLFKKLNILNFKNLVTQRISLLMFKHHLGILPHPINTLFMNNTSQHDYNTRQKFDLHTQIGKNEFAYKLFTFHGICIWNHISKKIPTDVSYSCYKKLSKIYIQNNNIPYRII